MRMIYLVLRRWIDFIILLLLAVLKKCDCFPVDLSVETLRLNVCVPYLLTIMHFFTDALTSLEVAHDVQMPPENHNPNAIHVSMPF